MRSEFVSDTLAACGNQYVLMDRVPNIQDTSRIFFKLFTGGKREYRFLYSNVMDSTYADGSISRAGDVLEPWTIHSLCCAVTENCDPAVIPEESFVPVLFQGKTECMINAERVYSDPVLLEAEKDQYLCLELTFSGKTVPYHLESMIAAFRKNPSGWVPSTETPFPLQIGVCRSYRNKIAFLGDSITQGIGTEPNSYAHYAAVCAELLGPENACWDLGIGYGRGADAAINGTWLSRARENDIVTLCYGVNDLSQMHQPEQVKKDLTYLVRTLKQDGIRVVLQTVPPFDYNEEMTAMWRDVNRYLREELASEADAFLDVVPILSVDGSADDPRTRYGSHPDNTGNRIWGQRLAPILRGLCEEKAE